MLKRILLFPMLVLFIPNLGAQDQFKSTTYIGISAGASISRVAFSPVVIHQGLVISNSVGLVFRHISEPHIGLQIEVNYTGKGWVENLDTIGNTKGN